jgi:uncharacterized protein
LIVLDTSFLYALLDRRDGRHPGAVAWIRAVDDELVTSPLVVAEVDYLVGRSGSAGSARWRREVVSGSFAIDWWPAIVDTMVEVADRYADLVLSLTDASLVALAERFETTSIATFDERHFRAVRPLTGEPSFRLLPLDA